MIVIMTKARKAVLRTLLFLIYSIPIRAIQSRHHYDPHFTASESQSRKSITDTKPKVTHTTSK
jgi:hypothetical protein